jgi:phthiocerol/phenolphthiocerol synthesis type-I polyketide synthase C
MALELRNRLEATLGITLPVALVWAHPSIATLADALCERMGYDSEADSGLADELNTEDSLSAEEADLLADFVDAGELEVTTGAAES